MLFNYFLLVKVYFFFPPLQDACRIIERQENEFLESLQPPGQSNMHNSLRTVGEWPIIFTTNMDRLVERLIWSGEDIEKLRLDQVSQPSSRRKE